jgi:hypothetical protein
MEKSNGESAPYSSSQRENHSIIGFTSASSTCGHWAQWIFLMIILTIFQTHRRLFPVSGDSTRFENFALYWNGRVRGLEYTQPFLFEPHRSKIKIISSEISLFISGIIMTSWKTDVISASIGHPNSSHTSQRPGTHVKLCSLLIKKNYIR